MKYPLVTFVLHPALGCPGLARPGGAFTMVFVASKHGLTRTHPELKARWKLLPWAERPAPPPKARTLVPAKRFTGRPQIIAPWSSPGGAGVPLGLRDVRAADPFVPGPDGSLHKVRWDTKRKWWQRKEHEQGILFCDPGATRIDGACHHLRFTLAPGVLDLWADELPQTIRLYFATVEPASRLGEGLWSIHETDRVASKSSEAWHLRALLTDRLRRRIPPYRLDLVSLAFTGAPSRAPKRQFFTIELDDLQYTEELDTEIVPHHPLRVVEREGLSTVAHLTDTHVDRRHEAFKARKIAGFNCFNDRFYENVRDSSEADAVVITGDLVDFNMGHDGSTPPVAVAPYPNYVFNGNWRLFYAMLVNCYDGRYQGTDLTEKPLGKRPGPPIFTTLGNHDYRPFPYAPQPHLLGLELYNTSSDMNLLDAELPLLDPSYTMASFDALETNRTATLWYHLVINPFLDYAFQYGRSALLALDWVEKEELDLKQSLDHLADSRNKNPVEAFPITDPLPRAESAYTEGQLELLQMWLRDSADAAHRIVASHIPAYSPRPDTGDATVKPPRFDWTGKDLTIMRRRAIERSQPLHPVTQMRHGPQSDDEALRYGVAAHRRVPAKAGDPSLVGAVLQAAKGVTLFLTGHSHRSGVFQVEGTSVRYLSPKEVNAGRWRSRNRVLFMITTSSGPLGFINEDGDPLVAFQGLAKRRLMPPGSRAIELVVDGGVPMVRTSERWSNGLPTVREDVAQEYRWAYFPGSLLRDP